MFLILASQVGLIRDIWHYGNRDDTRTLVIIQLCKSAWAAIIKFHRDFPGSPEVKTLPCNAGDGGSIPGLGTKILQAGGGWGGEGN